MPSGLFREPRDPEKVRKGGSNLLQIALTDAQADEVWADRFRLDVTTFDDTNDEIVVSGDYVMDFAIGRTYRVRQSSSNDGVFTVAGAASYDADNDETTVPVEESVSTETVSGSVYFEPTWVAGGWHRISASLMGGSITADRDVERVFDETDQEIAEVVNRDEDTVANVSAENDERFRRLLDWLEDHFVEARYFLPITAQGDYFESAAGDRYGDLRAWPHLSAQKGAYEEEVDSDARRTHDFTLNATRDPSSGIVRYERQVNLDEQTGWPSKLDDFKDDAVSTSRTMP
jgi:hypothetical protein